MPLPVRQKFGMKRNPEPVRTCAKGPVIVLMLTSHRVVESSSSSWTRLAKRSTGLLRLNDRKSRNRRIKKQRRYERLAATSQLSLGNFSDTSS